MPRRTNLDTTRARILAAALDLLTDDQVNFDPSAITLIDACRHAGLKTAGSGYKIWPTQEAFRSDLMRYAACSNDTISRRVAYLRELIVARPDPVDRTERIRTGLLERGSDSEGAAELIRQTALWLRAHRDEEVRDGYLQAQKMVVTALADNYRAVTETFGSGMAPGYTAEHMALAVEAAARGIAMMTAFSDTYGAGRIERPTGAEGELQTWNLIGCVTEAIVMAFTQPIDSEPSDSETSDSEPSDSETPDD